MKNFKFNQGFIKELRELKNNIQNLMKNGSVEDLAIEKTLKEYSDKIDNLCFKIGSNIDFEKEKIKDKEGKLFYVGAIVAIDGYDGQGVILGATTDWGGNTVPLIKLGEKTINNDDFTMDEVTIIK